MKDIRLGFAMCGSFCTHGQVLGELEKLCGRYKEITPILSENCRCTDTRFGTAAELAAAVERLTGKAPIDSVVKAEPIGPKGLLDILVIAPCTGNTLAKLAGGITDTAVTMAAKAHLRNGRPVVIALATNDGLSALRSGRSEKEALLSDGGFLPAGGDHRRSSGGPPAPAPAALTAEADTGGGDDLRRCCCIRKAPFIPALSSCCYDFCVVLWYDEDNRGELSATRKN